MNFSIQEAIEYAQWSNLAYGIDPIPNGTSFEWVNGLPQSDTQCLIIYEKDKIIFSFRGTNDIRKYIIDAQIKFKKIGDGIKVHTGFWNSLNSVWTPLAKIASKSRVPIITTGHSLGGALARQFTFRLMDEKSIKVQKSYTYGEPRSFNYKGAKYYNEWNIPTFRLEDDADIVPNVPWLLGSYWQVNNNAYIDSWLNILIGEPFYAHFWSDAWEIIKTFLQGKNALINDHSIKLYIDKLIKIQSNLF